MPPNRSAHVRAREHKRARPCRRSLLFSSRHNLMCDASTSAATPTSIAGAQLSQQGDFRWSPPLRSPRGAPPTSGASSCSNLTAQSLKRTSSDTADSSHLPAPPTPLALPGGWTSAGPGGSARRARVGRSQSEGDVLRWTLRGTPSHTSSDSDDDDLALLLPPPLLASDSPRESFDGASLPPLPLCVPVPADTPFLYPPRRPLRHPRRARPLAPAAPARAAPRAGTRASRALLPRGALQHGRQAREGAGPAGWVRRGGCDCVRRGQGQSARRVVTRGGTERSVARRGGAARWRRAWG